MAALKKNENDQEKCWNPISVTFTCEFIVTEFHHGHFYRNVPTIWQNNSDYL